ncbi:tetratricopeptide repeat protein [Falsiroseomonas sp.]|uniref:tetratricopeptide repeat protein n=1 Tax=Falsiroseomonas sp. TaxID=2870721 RepID=UPI0035635E8F
MLRFLVLPVLLLATPAFAQAPSGTPPGQPPVAGSTRPDPSAARTAELDRLFEALRDAPDSIGGQLVEARIRAIWAREVSPAAGLLMRRGLRNLSNNVPDEALEDFDAAITLQPEAADLWLMRARALAALGNRIAAAQDLREALRLEPRHFGALVELSELLLDAGDAEGALRSFDAALELHPRMAGAEERRRELRRRAFGDAL